MAMVVRQFYFRQKPLQLFVSLSVVFAFFVLLNNLQNFNLSRLTVQVPYQSNNKEPGAYIKYAHLYVSNESYCKFNYGFPDGLAFSADDLMGTPEFGIESSHTVLYNVIQGSNPNNSPAVTYATQLTKDFVVYVSEVVRYWEGPISIAAYVPDGNPNIILQQFLQLCYCIPDMSKVSLHLVFKSEIRSVSNPYKSSEVFVPPANCDIQNFIKLISSQTLSNNNSIKHQNPLNDWYPINVCRNVAREAALTDYVLVCDIELMPSQDLASRFITMLGKYKCNGIDCDKRVFVVPTFEVEDTEAVPRTKNQLVNLINQEKAVYFHRKICIHCQKFPGLEKWKETDPGDKIKALLVTKRETPYHRWEPIFIGTKQEPLYHEKLSWEGFQDKMLQMLEMCMMGYKLVILDGAFLVHWPGIKKTKIKFDTSRKPFKEMNQRQYNLLLKNISTKYPSNPQCRLK